MRESWFFCAVMATVPSAWGFQFSYLHWSKSVAITAQNVNSLSSQLLFPSIEGFSSLIFAEVNQWPWRLKASVLSHLSCSLRLRVRVSSVLSPLNHFSCSPREGVSCSAREGFQSFLLNVLERSSGSYLLAVPYLRTCAWGVSGVSSFSAMPLAC